MIHSVAVETVYPADQLAEEIDQTFLEIALTVSTEQKQGYAGERFELFSQAGVGKLEAIPLGRHYPEIHSFILRVLMRADGYDGNLGMWKDYSLRDYDKMKAGTPYDIQPIKPEELEGCPAPLAALAHLVHTLHAGYMATLKPEESHNESPTPSIAA